MQKLGLAHAAKQIVMSSLTQSATESTAPAESFADSPVTRQQPTESAFLMVVVPKPKTAFEGLSLLACAVLSNQRAFATYQANKNKRQGKNTAPHDIEDYRNRNRIAEQLGQHPTQVSKQCAVLQSKGLLKFDKKRRPKLPTKRQLTDKFWNAWNNWAKKESVPVPKELFACPVPMPFPKLFVLSYIAYRMGLTASQEFRTGRCDCGVSHISQTLNLARDTVMDIIDKLSKDGYFRIEVLKKKGGGKRTVLTQEQSDLWDPWTTVESADNGTVENADDDSPDALSKMRTTTLSKIEPCTVENADTSVNHLTSENEKEQGGQDGPPLRYAACSLNARPAAASRAGGVGQTTSANASEYRANKQARQDRELDSTCDALAKRSHVLLFNSAHPKWFLETRITAALVELFYPKVLPEFHCVPAGGLEPFTTNLQDALRSAFASFRDAQDKGQQKNGTQDETYFWGFLKKQFSKGGISCLGPKGPLRRVVRKRIDDLLRKISRPIPTPAPSAPAICGTSPDTDHVAEISNTSGTADTSNTLHGAAVMAVHVPSDFDIYEFESAPTDEELEAFRCCCAEASEPCPGEY